MRFLCSAELVGSQLAYAVSWPCEVVSRLRDSIPGKKISRY